MGEKSLVDDPINLKHLLMSPENVHEGAEKELPRDKSESVISKETDQTEIVDMAKKQQE